MTQQREKPREWFINPVVNYCCQANEGGISITGNEIHVVEYSALTAALAEVKRLRAEFHTTRILPDDPRLKQQVAQNAELREQLSAQAAELQYYKSKDAELDLTDKLTAAESMFKLKQDDWIAVCKDLDTAECLIEEMAGALRDMTKVGIDDSSGNSELVWCRQHAKAALTKYEGWKK